MKFKIFAIFLFAVVTVNTAFSQKQYTVAFYNVENLFDTINDKKKNDEEFLPLAENKWDSEKYANKLLHLSKVISELGSDDGPDVIGLCEIENRRVLMDLVKTPLLQRKGYEIVHYESPDMRGIDVALFYKKSLFTFIDSKKYKVKLPDKKRSATRDILMVQLLNAKNDTIVFFVNHFPSRLGGIEKSAPNRCTAAAILKSKFDSIIAANYQSNIVMMGDFNDEPDDSSIKYILKCNFTMGESSYNELYNPMLDLKKKGEGTIVYQKKYELIDQFMMSNHLLYQNNKLHYVPNSVTIFKPEYIQEQNPKYKGKPYRTFVGPKYLNGYSDHFPIYMKIAY
ncbi:MAG: endonuclease/exonuclease/phosphatase family protein [Bacteroidota bacterium]|nr:endonuclease/exonuclease/phosphatase family protein [Bacteroidota bacterium]